MITCLPAILIAQEKVYESFAGTRVINNHSTECLEKNNLEFIVAHKFGDFSGQNGGLSNFFGFDNLADVRIAFEYGIINDLTVGIGRNKGIGERTQVLDGFVKYRILHQKTSGMPISMVMVLSAGLPYHKRSNDSTSVRYYPEFQHRLIYTSQLLLTRKFHPRFTWQVGLGYNHRNYVSALDKNGLTFVSTGARFRFTKTLGILVEYTHVLNRPRLVVQQDHLAFSFEILTGGHIFALQFSNSTGVNENIFIPGTTENWLDGQWRFGFSLNRRFKL